MRGDPSRPRGSDYIRWAKSRETVRYPVGRSSIRPCPMRQLQPGLEELEVHGGGPDGWPPLLEALAGRYGVDVGRVVPAIGASMANHLVAAALLSPGDHVLVESPGYEPLRSLPAYLGCRVDTFARERERGWALEPEAVAARLRHDTRLVIVSDLHNPCGVRARPEALEALADLAERHDFHVLVDEVYLEFLPPATAPVAATRSPRLVSTSSLTKAYGLDGLRVGWIIANRELADRCRRLNDLFGIIMPHPSERLALRALQRAEHLNRDVERLVAENRTRVEALIERRAELEWVPPDAGPIGLVQLSGDVARLVEILEAKHDATVPPGHFFGAPDSFRIGFGMEPADCREGLQRLEAALDDLGAGGAYPGSAGAC